MNILGIKVSYSIGNNLILFLLILITVLTAYFFKITVYTNQIIYQDIKETISITEFEKIIGIQKKISLLSYLFLASVSFLKYLLISSILFIGLQFYETKVNFSLILRIVCLSEFILIIPAIIKILWFMYFKTEFSLSDIQLFYPLSILNLLDGNISNIWIYPLQLLNVFELTYWVALAYGISKLINNNFDKALKIVLSSYLPALVVWVVFVMFLTVTLNPG
jgi:hypothetical protein